MAPGQGPLEPGRLEALEAAGQNWPGGVSMTTRSAGALQEVGTGLCGLFPGAAPNQLQAAA